jgi:hypothetical protein
MEFKGMEKTFFDSNLDKHHGKVEADLKGKKVIHSQVITVAGFPNKQIPPGLYSYPFSIDLPYWLPSSFLHCGSQRSILKIFYSLKVGMEDL